MPGVRLIKFYLSTFECYDLDENDNLRISISPEIHQRKEHCDCQLRASCCFLFKNDSHFKEFYFSSI